MRRTRPPSPLSSKWGWKLGLRQRHVLERERNFHDRRAGTGVDQLGRGAGAGLGLEGERRLVSGDVVVDDDELRR